MQTQHKRLGKGLDALIPSIIPKTNESIEYLPIGSIQPNRFQPRKFFDDSSIKELATSIQENGLAQPVVVKKINDSSFELVVGERRLRACKWLKLKTIPCIIRDISDKESCKIALIENLDREDLSVIEIASSYQQLIQDFNLTQQDLSDQLGRSRSSIANILRLLKLPKAVQDLILNKSLSEGHARALLEFTENPEKCSEIANQIIDQNLTVRQAESLSKKDQIQKKSDKNSFQLFDNYVERLSEKFNSSVDIKHKKNKLTISVSYNKFKDYIAFLDLLCNTEDLSLES